MLKKQIEVGKYYWAKVDGLRFIVVVESIEEVRGHGERTTTVYHVQEPVTGHKPIIRSARDFYGEAKGSSLEEVMQWKRKKQQGQQPQTREDREQRKKLPEGKNVRVSIQFERPAKRTMQRSPMGGLNSGGLSAQWRD